MITFLQRLFQKHLKWMLFILLVAVIVPFVFTSPFGNSGVPGQGGTERSTFFGHDLQGPQEGPELYAKTAIAWELDFGSGFQPQPEWLQNRMIERLALLYLAEELELPLPGDAAVQAYLRERRPFQDAEGVYDAQLFEDFRVRTTERLQVSDGLIARVMREEVLINQVRELVQGPGFVLPAEVRDEMLREGTLYIADVATFDYATFEPDVTPDTAALEEFFALGVERYRRPDQVAATAILFPQDNYLEAVEVSDTILRAHFTRIQWRFRETPALTEDGTPPTPAPDPVFEDHVAEVEVDYRRQQARLLAERAASNFTVDLHQQQVPREGDALTQRVEAVGARFVELEPYALGERPPGVRVPSQALDQVFDYLDTRYFTDAFPSAEGSWVVLRDAIIESTEPVLVDVREAVEADYLAEEKRRLFVEKGASLRESLQTSLAEGVSFTEAAAALGLAVERYEDFRLSAPPEGAPSAALDAVSNLDEGEVSPMVALEAEGYLVHVAEETPPLVSPEDESYEQRADQLASTHARMSASSLIQELIFIESGGSGS